MNKKTPLKLGCSQITLMIFNIHRRSILYHSYSFLVHTIANTMMFKGKRQKCADALIYACDYLSTLGIGCWGWLWIPRGHDGCHLFFLLFAPLYCEREEAKRLSSYLCLFATMKLSVRHWRPWEEDCKRLPIRHGYFLDTISPLLNQRILYIKVVKQHDNHWRIFGGCRVVFIPFFCF